MLQNLIGKRGSSVLDYKQVLASPIAEYERGATLRLDTSRVADAQIVRHLLAERDIRH